MDEFRGIFEVHITVAFRDDQSVATLTDWAAPRGMKSLDIELARGNVRSQPMLTWRRSGTRKQALTQIESISAELARDGFRVVRVKLEASPTNDDVPAHDGAASCSAPGQYFEHHVKLLLSPEDCVGVITDIAERHGAHVSRNALRRRDDGHEERFVTQRCWKVGNLSAQSALHCLLDELRSTNCSILDVESEYVVYDSNLGLDSGWI